MNLELLDRVAFVAGSSRGIGKAIAIRLLEEGCRVALTGRDEASLEATSRELCGRFGEDRLLTISGDLTNGDVLNTALAKTIERWSQIDLLVANLGTGRGKSGWDVEEEEWSRLFDLNFHGSRRLAKAAIPVLSRSNAASIVFISSIVGIEATSAPLPYSAAKAALMNYSKNLARSVADLRIRVNCVVPGNILFEGGSWERRLKDNALSTETFIKNEVPQKRFGGPEEIADLVAFLSSSKALFITGAAMVADGGQTRSI